MRTLLGALVCAALVLGPGLACGGAQEATAQRGPATVEDALHVLADEAGVIFTGTVTAVRRPAGAGVVEIEFAVADAVRGVSGPTYILREWAGLWPANDEPFRIGQRYLMLLHAPNAAGLSSPVAGGDGAIPIYGGAPAPGPSAPGVATGQTVAAEADLAGSAVLDLGWVATRVVTPVRYAAPGVARPVTVSAKTVSSPGQTATASVASVPAGHRASYAATVSLLRQWNRTREAANAAAR